MDARCYDAYILAQANVGISLGIEGKEIAKQASDCILMDDNFVSLASAIEICRTATFNIRRIYQFHLTCMTVIAMTLFFGMCITGDYVLTPAQVLIVYYVWHRVMRVSS